MARDGAWVHTHTRPRFCGGMVPCPGQDSRTIWIDGRHRCLMPVLDFVNNKDLAGNRLLCHTPPLHSRRKP
jgi:hypothetical protein